MSSADLVKGPMPAAAKVLCYTAQCLPCPGQMRPQTTISRRHTGFNCILHLVMHVIYQHSWVCIKPQTLDNDTYSTQLKTKQVMAYGTQAIHVSSCKSKCRSTEEL